MRYCAAFGCNNGSSTERNRKYIKDNNITFHGFPLKDHSRLQAWLTRIGRKGFSPSKHSSLCSEHFAQEDFAFQPFTNMRLLKDTAVPSKFSHNSSTNLRGAFAESSLNEMKPVIITAGPSDSKPVEQTISFMSLVEACKSRLTADSNALPGKDTNHIHKHGSRKRLLLSEGAKMRSTSVQTDFTMADIKSLEDKIQHYEFAIMLAKSGAHR